MATLLSKDLKQILQSTLQLSPHFLGISGLNHLLQQLDPRVTYFESSYLFKLIDSENRGVVETKLLEELLVSWDYCELSQRAQTIIRDLREIIKMKGIDMSALFWQKNLKQNGQLTYKEFKDLVRSIFPKMKEYDTLLCFNLLDQN